MVETTKVNGRTLSFRREPGRGPTLVLVHGSADNHHSYDRLVAALPDVARVAVDSPGRLGSEGPPASGVPELTEVISGFIDAEVEGDYVAAGHSLGGAVAIEHALVRASPRLKGIVLLATGARLRVHPMILKLFEQLTESGTPPGPTPGLFEPGSDPGLVAEIKEILRLTPPASGLADWTAANSFNRMSDVANISIPALMIAGTSDSLTPPKYAEYLAAQIPQSELLILEGAGHVLPMERADEVSRAICTFLASL